MSSRASSSKVARVEQLLDEISNHLEEVVRLESLDESGQKPWNNAGRKLRECHHDIKELETIHRKNPLTIGDQEMDHIFQRTNELSQKHGAFDYDIEDRNEINERRNKLKQGSNLVDFLNEFSEGEREALDEQDEYFDNISSSIGRHQKFSEQIFDEIDAQNQLLDDLDERMGSTANEMDRNRQLVEEVIEFPACKVGLGLVLFVIMVVLIIFIVTL